MQDSRARHRLPRGGRCRGDSRLPLADAARPRAALLPVVLLLFLAPPAIAIGPVIGSDASISASTGDPDDGEHRELPSVKTGVVVTDPLPDVTPPASAEPALSSPVNARGSTGRVHLLRRTGLPGPASLWTLLRTWILHR